jgi:hypothetical protein
VAPAQRFCGYCGTSLSRVAQKYPVPARPSWNKPIPEKMQFSGDRSIPENFKGFTGSKQRQIQPVNNIINQKRLISAGRTAMPLRREIFKLLSSLMEKQGRNN